MEIESTDLLKEIDSMSDTVNELMNLIQNDDLSLEEKNNIHFKIIDIVQHIRPINDTLSEKLKVVQEFQEMLSEMLTYYPYKSPDSGKE